MSDDRKHDEVEATLPGGTKLRVRGYDFLTIAVIAWMAVQSYISWRHAEDTENTSRVQAAVLATVAKEQKIQTEVIAKEQRFATCIIATKEADRETQYGNPNSFCNRMAR